MLVEWRLKEKLGPDTIARRLTEAGVPTPSGRSAWSDSTINCLLMPERLLQFAGYGTWNKCGTDYYLCGSQIYRHGADCITPWYIRREEADKATFECIGKFFASDPEHIRAIVEDHNKWVNSERALYASTTAERDAEIQRLEKEISNLMKSLAEGIDPSTVRADINSRAAQRDHLRALPDTVLPEKVTLKDVQAQIKKVSQIAQSRDPNRRRSAIRRYIFSMQADSERRVIRVLMHPLSTVCGNWVVAPGGVEPPPRP